MVEFLVPICGRPDKKTNVQCESLNCLHLVPGPGLVVIIQNHNYLVLCPLHSIRCARTRLSITICCSHRPSKHSPTLLHWWLTRMCYQCISKWGRSSHMLKGFWPSYHSQQFTIINCSIHSLDTSTIQHQKKTCYTCSCTLILVCSM